MAMAINCFVFSGSAPSSKTVLLKFRQVSMFLGAKAAFLSATSLVAIGYRFSVPLVKCFNCQFFRKS